MSAALALTACDRDRELTLRFAPIFGAEPFACGQDYAGVGTADSTVTPLDFRLYVHDLALVRAGGERVPIAVYDDARWQHEG
ncbi:MAG: metallo-mystery pair system four-Cys motif protein, partial [Myxococcales bacterium]|nr:metallo-mystery pair system four-Cys motif protein [Myxococcales bacterium]